MTPRRILILAWLLIAVGIVSYASAFATALYLRPYRPPSCPKCRSEITTMLSIHDRGRSGAWQESCFHCQHCNWLLDALRA